MPAMFVIPAELPGQFMGGLPPPRGGPSQPAAAPPASCSAALPPLQGRMFCKLLPTVPHRAQRAHRAQADDC